MKEYDTKEQMLLDVIDNYCHRYMYYLSSLSQMNDSLLSERVRELSKNEVEVIVIDKKYYLKHIDYNKKYIIIYNIKSKSMGEIIDEKT